MESRGPSVGSSGQVVGRPTAAVRRNQRVLRPGVQVRTPGPGARCFAVDPGQPLLRQRVSHAKGDDQGKGRDVGSGVRPRAGRAGTGSEDQGVEPRRGKADGCCRRPCHRPRQQPPGASSSPSRSTGAPVSRSVLLARPEIEPPAPIDSPSSFRDDLAIATGMALLPADRKIHGGNRQKNLFGMWLRIELGTLLLDEPTQGVNPHRGWTSGRKQSSSASSSRLSPKVPPPPPLLRRTWTSWSQAATGSWCSGRGRPPRNSEETTSRPAMSARTTEGVAFRGGAPPTVDSAGSPSSTSRLGGAYPDADLELWP